MSAPLLRLLLLEDNPADAHVIRSMLRKSKFEIRWVGRLAEALEVLPSTEIDEILVDLNLPDSRGLDTLDRILAHDPSKPVVVITGFDDEATALQALARGAQDYLVKGRVDAAAVVHALKYGFKRKEADEQIRAREASMRAILENALDAVVGMDRNGVVTGWNRRAEEVFGWSRQEAIGKTMADLIIPERFREDHRRGLARLLATGQGSILGKRIELSALRRDGTEFPIELAVTAIANGHGITFCGFVSDISARKTGEERLRASEQRFRALVENSADGILLLDREAKIVYASPAITRILGYWVDEVIGVDIFSWIHPDDAAQARARFQSAMVDEARPEFAEYRARHKDGSWRRIEVIRGNRLHDPAIRAVIVNYRDVTDRWTSQEMFGQMQRQIEQNLRVVSLGQVAATVAHEFNNVLMAILPFAQLLQRKLAGQAGCDVPVRNIIAAVHRGARVTEQILRFANPAEPRIEQLEAPAWLRAFVLQAHMMFADRDVTMEADTPFSVRADPAQLAQVMLNLLTNARDATAPGAPITVGAVLADDVQFLRDRLTEPGHFGAFFARDRGPGIPEDVLARIFEPLFTTKRTGGTGLGLAVSHQIVVHHGGELLVETAVGVGTTFYVVLPLARSVEA